MDVSATILNNENYRPIGGPVPPHAHLERLDGYLSRHYPFLSRAGWQKKIREGGLLVNGKVVKVAARLQAGDQIVLYYPYVTEPDVDRGVRVLWADEYLLAAYKPGNLPMHENGPYRNNTFARILGDLVGDEWAAVHRLDRETSGLVLCARDLRIRQRLSDDWASRRVKKEYLAIVHGVASEDHWHVDQPIGDLVESRIRIKKWVVPGGLPAQTDFVAEGRTATHTLLRCFPLTGRTNQIRIHAAWSGLHLVGDKTYHPDENVFLEYFAKGNTSDVQRQTGFVRMCLHATRLTLVHPVTNQELDLHSPMPEDMLNKWTALTCGRLDSPTNLKLGNADRQILGQGASVVGLNHLGTQDLDF